MSGVGKMDAAWKFTKEKGIDMVTINPVMVIGPLLQPTLNTSAAAILNLRNGSQTFPNSTFGWVNVKDVANSHIQAFEIPSTNGRYCLVESIAHYSEVVKILQEQFPAFQLPEKWMAVCLYQQCSLHTNVESGASVFDLKVALVRFGYVEYGVQILCEILGNECGRCGGEFGSDPKKTEHLLALEGAKERLHLTKANLLEEGCFDSLVDGCEGVFHIASPCYHDVKDPQVELIDPALKGTLNVLGSCAKNPSVKRVVLTSSVAAVAFNGRPLSPDVVVDESWFSDPEFCKQNKLWYTLSKTLAEDAAWKFTKEKGIDMVTINPATVIGPLLQPTLNTSAARILNLINGSQTFPNSTFGWVNVKDVANAHIQAFEIPSANGRYCLAESVAHLSEVVKILQELFPAFQLPEKCADDKPFTPTYQVSKERTKSLGIEFIPLKQSIKETVESLKEKKLFTW
ncbi:Cinnamoyl-CoA reductase 1 [Camellia lanceoleosa]|uniref:Cinnamoyl-CoA reductase 1 n=1 Tax=Camellia lanceoleosa TaxID=1840588 RepID=A0ACC0F4D8_9ERIC|nr:Cinnamoyl-CoA reductase 1 [Camellia lanceoleosa]